VLGLVDLCSGASILFVTHIAGEFNESRNRPTWIRNEVWHYVNSTLVQQCSSGSGAWIVGPLDDIAFNTMSGITDRRTQFGLKRIETRLQRV
jgi:hypothetical protein